MTISISKLIKNPACYFINNWFRSKPIFKAVLFDLDGSLVDTETTGGEVIKKVLSEFSIEITQKETEHGIGITARKFYEDLLESKGIKNRTDEILQRHMELYEESLKKDLKPFNGSTILPKQLKSLGYKLAIVSGSTRSQIEIVLNQIGIRQYFDLIVSCDDISKSKPDPEGYLIAARLLNLSPSECLVIEDSTSGIKAGKAAGMKVIGVENLGKQDLSLADFIVKDLTEVDIVKQ